MKTTHWILLNILITLTVATNAANQGQCSTPPKDLSPGLREDVDGDDQPGLHEPGTEG